MYVLNHPPYSTGLESFYFSFFLKRILEINGIFSIYIRGIESVSGAWRFRNLKNTQLFSYVEETATASIPITEFLECRYISSSDSFKSFLLCKVSTSSWTGDSVNQLLPVKPLKQILSKVIWYFEIICLICHHKCSPIYLLFILCIFNSLYCYALNAHENGRRVYYCLRTNASIVDLPLKLWSFCQEFFP